MTLLRFTNQQATVLGPTGSIGPIGNPGLPGLPRTGAVSPWNPVHKSLFEVRFESYPLFTEIVKSFSIDNDQIRISFNVMEMQSIDHLGRTLFFHHPIDEFEKNKDYNIEFLMYDKRGIVTKNRKVKARLINYSTSFSYSSSDLVVVETIFSYEPT